MNDLHTDEKVKMHIDNYLKEKVFSGWHLKKEIHIAQLITLVCLFSTGIWYVAGLETKIYLNAEVNKRQDIYIESLIDTIKKQQQIYHQNYERHFQIIREDMKEIKQSVGK